MRKKREIIGTIILESIKLILISSSNKRIISNTTNTLYFSWGILWEILSPLILIIGLSLLVTFGVRGQGLVLDYMIFIFLFWFGFTSMISKMIGFNVNDFQVSKVFINPWVIIFCEFIVVCFGVFVRFLLVLFAMYLLGFEIKMFYLLSIFIFLYAFGFVYGINFSATFHGNTFVKDVHSFFIQSLFFLSSIIIPVPNLPIPIRDILLYNPLVHLFEWLKVPYTGVKYSFIDIDYFISFLIVLTLTAPIAIYVKNNLIKYGSALRKST
jgi:capsular polysaccharide transport system permease protein